MVMSYLFLALATVFEVGWAVSMKASHGFTRPIPTAAMLVMYVLSLVFLTFAVKRLDISVAYAIWAGLGAAFIACIGIVWFQEPATALKIVSLGLVVAGVIGLNLAGGGHAPVPPATPTPGDGAPASTPAAPRSAD